MELVYVWDVGWVCRYLGDAALHDDKVGVVDVELDGLEEGLDVCL